jgi:hypothetical protein
MKTVKTKNEEFLGFHEREDSEDSGSDFTGF